MLDEMPPGLFDEWLEFADLEPFGALAEAKQRAMAISIAIAAASGDQPVNDILREWGFDVEDPPFNPATSEAAVKAAYGC